MATSDFQYASTAEFVKLFPNIGVKVNNKFPIRNWQTTGTSNLYEAHSTGYFSLLYFNGEEGTAVSIQPSSDGEFKYTDNTDSVLFFHDDHNPNDILMEGGEDYKLWLDDRLEMASQELNGMLDSRFPTPIPKQFFYDETTPDWDYIIKKLTCYICAINIMRADNPLNEEIDPLKEELDEMLQRLNSGEIRLKCEINNSDKNGEVIVEHQSGTMYLVETYCEQWIGSLFDKVKITCTTLGAYGVAKIKVEMLGGNKIAGDEVLTNHFVTGGLQHIGNGLYVRFEGASMDADDIWHIKIRRNDLEETNSSVKDIPIHRGRREMFR